MFNHLACSENADLRLRQGQCTMADFSVAFRVLLAETGWNDEALYSSFKLALSKHLKDQLATRDEPATLDDLITLSITLHNCLCVRCRDWEMRLSNPCLILVPSALVDPKPPRPLSTSP